MELGGGLSGSSRPHSARNRILWITLFSLLAAIGLTFAARITINTNNQVEFGQGIYQIKACDQYVALEFVSTSAYANGFSRVGAIVFKGLDVQKCKGTAMRLRLYKSGSNTPLNLYTNSKIRHRALHRTCPHHGRPRWSLCL